MSLKQVLAGLFLGVYGLTKVVMPSFAETDDLSGLVDKELSENPTYTIELNLDNVFRSNSSPEDNIFSYDVNATLDELKDIDYLKSTLPVKKILLDEMEFSTPTNLDGFTVKHLRGMPFNLYSSKGLVRIVRDFEGASNLINERLSRGDLVLG